MRDDRTQTITVQELRRVRRRARRIPGVVGLIPLVVGLGIWQLAGSLSGTSSLSFPTPSTWFTAIADMGRTGQLLPAIGETLGTFVFGSLLALATGIVLGVAIGSSRILDRAFSPVLGFFRTLPPPVIVSVAALILGITIQASIVIVAFSVVWPILLNTVTAVRTVPPVRMDMARSMNLAAWERFTKVLLPSILPGIAIGLRISLSSALVIALLVDLLTGQGGLGRLLLEKQQTFDASSVWGLLLIVGIIGYLLNELLALLERRVFRSRTSS